jgi:hypothetical protein
VPIDELFVIDDASTDSSSTLIESSGVRIIRSSSNEGRGAVRRRALECAKNELVLGCDAGIALSPEFVERALPWFEDERVAAVQGIIEQPNAPTVASRWRGRHLFKVDPDPQLSRRTLHATTACLVRKSEVMRAGNYRCDLREGEDKELGERLLGLGLDVISDPNLSVRALSDESIVQVLERYSRWHAGHSQIMTFRDYVKQIAYATKIMVVKDLKDGDLLSVPISLISPHYQFWRSRCSSTRSENSDAPNQS